MKLDQGVRALSVLCVGLLAALALWRHAEPDVRAKTSRRASGDDAAVRTEAEAQTTASLADPLPEATRTEAIASATVRPARLRLVPNENGVRVCGSVKLPDGTCPTNTRVALFVKNSSDPDATPLHETACEQDGTYCVSAARAGDFALAVFAPGFRPATRLLELSMGAVEDLGEIELERGVAIEGAVHTDGEPHPGVELVAILSSGGTAMRTEDASLRWTRGAFEWSFTTARNDADGRYRIAGLRPGPYRVRITAMRGPHAIFGYKTLEAMAVDAPVDGIDFKLATSSLDLRIEHGKQPVDAANAELEAQGFHLGRVSDEHGLVTMKTLPDIACNLIVRKKGYKPRLIPFETPAVGETHSETVELEPSVEQPRIALASLRVELVPNTEEHVPVARFAFFAADTTGSEPLFRRWDVHSARSANTGAAWSTTFVVDDIPSGHYRVSIQAGAPLAKGAHSPTLTQYCDVEFEIAVPKSGEVSRRIALESRGYADVLVRGADGSPVPAQFKLRSNEGIEVHMLRSNAGFKPHAPNDERRTRIYAEACSGAFQLEIACKGYISRRLPVTIVPGIVSPIEVTLERE